VHNTCAVCSSLSLGGLRNPYLHSIPSLSTGADHLELLLNAITKSAKDALVEYQKLGEDVPLLDFNHPHPLDRAEDTIAFCDIGSGIEAFSIPLAEKCLHV
jgi:hypothetical protein